MLKLMTRMGSKALTRIKNEGSFVKGLHSIGELDPDRRFIMHFPDELRIMSYGSGYGGGYGGHGGYGGYGHGGHGHGGHGYGSRGGGYRNDIIKTMFGEPFLPEDAMLN